MSALAGTVGSAIPPAVLVALAVAGGIVLGVEGYKYLTAEKVGAIPSIAEQILEMARRKKEEQEAAVSGSDDGVDIVNPGQEGEMINPDDVPDTTEEENIGRTEEEDTEDENVEDEYYKKGRPEGGNPREDTLIRKDTAKVKSRSFKEFLEKLGETPEGEFYERHYWTNGTDSYYHE